MGGARLISSASTTELKIGPGMEAEGLRALVVDRHAQHVGGQEVARELHAGVLEPERCRQRLGEGGLAHAGDVLDEEMPARQEAGERQAQRVVLADDDAAQLGKHQGQACGGGGAGLGGGAQAHGRRRMRVTTDCSPALPPRHVRRARGTLRLAENTLLDSRVEALVPMTVAYITHPSSLLHDMGDYHPECPERINAVNDRLIASGLDAYLLHRTAAPATREQLARVHGEAFIDSIEEASRRRDCTTSIPIRR